METVLLGLRDLSMEMQEVKAMHINSSELGKDHAVVTRGMEAKEA